MPPRSPLIMFVAPYRAAGDGRKWLQLTNDTGQTIRVVRMGSPFATKSTVGDKVGNPGDYVVLMPDGDVSVMSRAEIAQGGWREGSAPAPEPSHSAESDDGSDAEDIESPNGDELSDAEGVQIVSPSTAAALTDAEIEQMEPTAEPSTDGSMEPTEAAEGPTPDTPTETAESQSPSVPPPEVRLDALARLAQIALDPARRGASPEWVAKALSDLGIDPVASESYRCPMCRKVFTAATIKKHLGSVHATALLSLVSEYDER